MRESISYALVVAAGVLIGQFFLYGSYAFSRKVALFFREPSEKGGQEVPSIKTVYLLVNALALSFLSSGLLVSGLALPQMYMGLYLTAWLLKIGDVTLSVLLYDMNDNFNPPFKDKVFDALNNILLYYLVLEFLILAL